MRATHTEHSTRVYTLAGGTEENDLWVHDIADDVHDGQYGTNIIASVWVPTPEEREAIANGENIRLLIWAAPEYRVPPFSMDTTDEKLTDAPPRSQQES